MMRCTNFTRCAAPKVISSSMNLGSTCGEGDNRWVESQHLLTHGGVIGNYLLLRRIAARELNTVHQG